MLEDRVPEGLGLTLPNSMASRLGEEFAKLLGTRALFGYFITLLVTKIVKFLEKIDSRQ